MLERIHRIRARVFPGAIPSKIFFIHVPKCGGSSVKMHLRASLGSRKSGATVRIKRHMYWDTKADQFEATRSARFIYGHFGYDTLKDCRHELGDVTITFLREPQQRILSLYQTMSRYTPDDPEKLRKAHYDVTHRMTLRQFLTCDDQFVRSMIDNYMVRQFAGRLTAYSVAEEEWPRLLERAKNNLASINYIGFHDSYERDFRVIMKRLSLPVFFRVPQVNRRIGDPVIVTARDRELLAELTQYDSQLYIWAI